MRKYLPASTLGAIAAAAMLLPFAAAPAAAQTPGGSYLHSCRDVNMRGNRLVATCRNERGRWNRTALNNVGRCAGGVANADGRLVCGTRGGGFNVGSERGHWRGGEGYGSSYGGPYGPGRDAWGHWQGGNWGYYGR